MKRFETPHYIFHYGAGTLAEAHIQAIAGEQEACYAYICQVLGVALNCKISYFLCDSPEEVGRIYGDNDPCNGFCVMPDKIYAVYNDKVKCIGFHEDAHIISYSIGRPNCPALREGLAMYFDRKWWGIHNMDWTAYYLRTGAYVPVHTLLDRETFFSLNCELTYPIMGAFTDYLIATYGMESYKRIYQQGDIAAAMEAVYGQSSQQLNDAFVSYVRLFRLDEAVASRMETLLSEN